MKIVKKGDKIKGFKFESKAYAKIIDEFIGQIGIVEFVDKLDDTMRVKFTKPNTLCLWYPINHKLAKPLSKLKNKLK